MNQPQGRPLTMKVRKVVGTLTVYERTSGVPPLSRYCVGRAAVVLEDFTSYGNAVRWARLANKPTL